MILGVVNLADTGQILNIYESYPEIYDRTSILFPAYLFEVNGGVVKETGWFDNW
jgi:hypothetical protein